MLTKIEEARRLNLREKLTIAEAAKALLVAEANELKALDAKRALPKAAEDEVFPEFVAKKEVKKAK